VTALLFDLDGTLVDSADDILAALSHTIRALGLDPAPDPEAGRPHLGHPLNVMLDRMGYDWDPAAYPDIIGVYAAYYMEHWKDRSDLYPGVRGVLEGLAGRDLAVVTQKRQNQADGMVAAFGLDAHFSAVVGMAEGLAPKPAPDLLLLAASRLGVAPAHAVMVGDTVLDVEAGRAAAMTTVAVTWGFGDPRPAGPDHLVRTADELAALLATL